MPLVFGYLVTIAFGFYVNWILGVTLSVILLFYFRERLFIWSLICLILFTVNCNWVNMSLPFKVLEVTENKLVLLQNGLKVKCTNQHAVSVNQLVFVSGNLKLSSLSEYGHIGTISNCLITSKISVPVIDLPIFEHNQYQSNILKILASSGAILSTCFSLFIEIVLLLKRKRINLYKLIFFGIIFLSEGITMTFVRLFFNWIIKFFKFNKNTAILIEMTFVLSIFPFGYHKLTFLIPYGIKLTDFIFTNRRNLKLKKIITLSLLLSLVRHQFGLLQLVLMPVFRVLLKYAILISFLPLMSFSLVMDGLDKIFTFFDQFDYVFIGQIDLFMLLISVITIIFVKKFAAFLMILLLIFVQIKQAVIFKTEVIFLNVGQGDATLIKDKRDQMIYLIDTGSKKNYRMLKNRLFKYGVSKIDYLIITHQDEDHSGNVDNLYRDFTVRNLVTLKGQLNRKQFIEYLDDVHYDNKNQNSLILKYMIDNNCILFLGDADQKVERDLVSHNPEIRCNFVKLGHHGSKTSSDMYFLDKVNSRIGIISSDPQIYGHPHQETIDTLDKLRIKYFSTFEFGDIHLQFWFGHWWIYNDFKWIIVL